MFNFTEPAWLTTSNVPPRRSPLTVPESTLIFSRPFTSSSEMVPALAERSRSQPASRSTKS